MEADNRQIRYPIGIQTFEQIIEEGYLYIDKTDLVYKLAHSGKIYFLSRPRRFGKSLLVSTLDAYFSGRKELFEGLAISRLESEWNQYPVFRIDFNINFQGADKLEDVIRFSLDEWENKYGRKDSSTDYGLRFINVLRQAHERTGRRCVVLTGVTKFSQVSVFSGFNQPEDITMSREYETVCGITQDELEKYFERPIREFADYRATVERPLPMIYQSGYLTIRDYDPDYGTYRLDIPNNEVKAGWSALLKRRRRCGR